MKLARCPVCHSHLHLDALVQDDAGRELLVEVAKLPDFVAKPMLSYLGLFRPAKSDLSNARALKLLREVQAEYRADHVLASALVETVSKLREKRTQFSDAKPLANHNYLKQVFTSVSAKVGTSVPSGKRASAERTPEPKPAIDTAWYEEQAKRLIRAGQDPLKSTIAATLKEIGWQPPIQ